MKGIDLWCVSHCLSNYQQPQAGSAVDLCRLVCRCGPQSSAVPEVGDWHHGHHGITPLFFVFSEIFSGSFVNYLGFCWVGVGIDSKKSVYSVYARQCFLCFWHTWVLQLQVNGRQVALKSSFVCFFFWAFYHPKFKNGMFQNNLLYLLGIFVQAVMRRKALGYYHNCIKSYVIYPFLLFQRIIRVFLKRLGNGSIYQLWPKVICHHFLLRLRKVKVAVLQLLRELLQSSQELCPRQTGLWMPILHPTTGWSLWWSWWWLKGFFFKNLVVESFNGFNGCFLEIDLGKLRLNLESRLPRVTRLVWYGS